MDTVPKMRHFPGTAGGNYYREYIIMISNPKCWLTVLNGMDENGFKYLESSALEIHLDLKLARNILTVSMMSTVLSCQSKCTL